MTTRRTVAERLPRLILLRHGESGANAADLFTGSLDVPLTHLGRQQSADAGHLIQACCTPVDDVVSSPLARAVDTARIVQEALQSPGQLVIDWRLTERSYGVLTGRSKEEVLHEVGPAQYADWRRSIQHAPPPMTDEQLALLRSQPAFRGLPECAVAPTESLRDVILRVRHVLDETITPRGRAGRTVLVVAHGNSLRALVGVLEGLDDQQLQALTIPAGHPYVYRLQADGTPEPGHGTYLDPPAAQRATAILERLGGT